MFDGKFYITILDFKKGGLGDFHGIGQILLGVATDIAQFAHLLAQFVLQGVVHEAWSIVFVIFRKCARICNYTAAFGGDGMRAIAATALKTDCPFLMVVSIIDRRIQ